MLLFYKAILKFMNTSYQWRCALGGADFSKSSLSDRWRKDHHWLERTAGILVWRLYFPIRRLQAWYNTHHGHIALGVGM